MSVLLKETEVMEIFNLLGKTIIYTFPLHNGSALFFLNNEEVQQYNTILALKKLNFIILFCFLI